MKVTFTTHTYIYIYMNITSLKLRFNNQQSFYYKLPRIVDKGTDQKSVVLKKINIFQEHKHVSFFDMISNL